jgi:O-antigen/teichoic acid export membrane protein
VTRDPDVPVSVVPQPRGLGRRLVTNTLHAATGRAAAVLVWILLTPPILRVLGTEGFAVWALFFALTGYFAALDLGLVQGTLRHVAAARERGAHGEAGAFAVLGVLGFLALGALWLALALLLRNPLMEWLRIPQLQIAAASFAVVVGAGVFTLAGCANITMAVLQGYDRFDLANLISLVVTLEQAAGILIVLRNGWGLPGLVVNVGVGWALGLVAGVLALRGFVPAFRWTGSRPWPYVPDVLAFGGPMQLASLWAVLHTNLDKFLLPVFVALSAVTPYELGSRVVGSIQAFPQMLLLAMLPAASAFHAAGDRARLRELYVRGGSYLLTASAMMVAVLLGSADRLFTVWLGQGHAEAVLVLRGLSLATGIALATGMASITARAVGRTDLEAWFGAIVVALHVALSLLLLPRFGLPGAVFANLAATVVASCCYLLFVGRVLRWRAVELLVKPHVVPLLAVAAGAVTGLALDRALPVAAGAVAWMLLALVAGVAGVVTLAVLIATGYFHWREARSLLMPS